MIDPLLQVQEEATARLDYEETFRFIAVRSLRKELISSQIERVTPHLTAKNNRNGCGTLVGMPTLEGIDPNVSSPQFEILIPIDVIECPELNMSLTGGTLLSAEEVARNVLKILHAWRNEGLIFLAQDKMAMQPLEGIEKQYPGCLGYRVMLRGRLKEDSLPKLSCPALTEAPGLTLTLVPSGLGQTVIYTEDGTQPIPTNTAAVLYTTPFTVPDGTTIRWAAYAPGWIGSDYGWAKIHATT